MAALKAFDGLRGDELSSGVDVQSDADIIVGKAAYTAISGKGV